MSSSGDHLGLYLSVPFCRHKCTFCNFASDVFPEGRMEQYVDRLVEEIAGARLQAESLGADLPSTVDTLYFGGGTPSLLSPALLRRVFAAVGTHFALLADAEVTLEAAPGQIADGTLEAALELGVKRISLGVQSFVDRESAAVGRLHTGAECEAEFRRLRERGIAEISLDLIAGLPHQTRGSWQYSLERALESGVSHFSVYMLEVDGDSRLGREMLAGGSRYGAPATPSDDLVADLYLEACELMERAGIPQYEISNFARRGHGSRHNMKYWTRAPYLGFGVDAHSMLRSGNAAVRFANTESMDIYLGMASASVLPMLASVGTKPSSFDHVGPDEAFEEAVFLGLRLNRGVSLQALTAEHGLHRTMLLEPAIAELHSAGLLLRTDGGICLTPAGRLASNEVFSHLLSPTFA